MTLQQMWTGSPVQATGHANLWYVERVRALVVSGARVEARGRVRWEVLHALTQLPDPRKRVLTVPYRRANPFFQIMEPVWMLAGSADAGWIGRYNSQLGQYLDPRPRRSGGADNDAFHGAYGERLRRFGDNTRLGVVGEGRDQLRDVIRQLAADHGSTRAALVLRNPQFDNPDLPTLDMPCNIAGTFQLRDDRLACAIFNRSNDLNLGLAYTNLVQFTTLQEFLACAPDVGAAGPGPFSLFSSSLHVYNHDPVTERIMAPHRVPPFDVYDYVDPCPMAMWKGPGAGFALIDELYHWVAEGLPESTRRAEEIATAYACPYWRSVASMAAAWWHLKDDPALLPADQRLAYTLPYLVAMPAKDWQVAALEFVHRWAVRRRITTTFGELLGALWADLAPGYRDPDAVRGFILHDTLGEAPIAGGDGGE